jgi:hypothetical protein
MRKPLALALALPVLAAPVFAAPAQAAIVVDKQKLEKNIERTLKAKLSLNAEAKCPKRVTWVKGKTFTCKVTATNGTKGTVQVTLRSNPTKGRLSWKLL